jgi:hypothetical protein
MGFIEGIFRAATSPIEVVARTVYGVLDFDDMSFDNELIGLDIATLGATRIIRKGASAIKDTAGGIVRDIDA